MLTMKFSIMAKNLFIALVPMIVLVSPIKVVRVIMTSMIRTIKGTHSTTKNPAGMLISDGQKR